MSTKKQILTFDIRGARSSKYLQSTDVVAYPVSQLNNAEQPELSFINVQGPTHKERTELVSSLQKMLSFKKIKTWRICRR